MGKFTVTFLPEAEDFIDALEDKARRKVLYNITKAQTSQDKELFKKLTTDIWEFRTLYNKTAYRLFAFWDKKEKTVVVCTHGMTKTTDKTPLVELEKAKRLRKLYLGL